MKKIMMTVVLVLCITMLFGCGKKQETEVGDAYQIYGLEQGNTRLESVEYRTETTNQDELVTELMEQFCRKQLKDKVSSALPVDVMLSHFRFENEILYLDFSPEYSSMSTVAEILCRGALVSTFTQIDGVNSVAITIGEQPLLDKDGNPVSAQKDTDFVDIVGRGLNSVSKVSLTLYFTNGEGNRLLRKKEEVVYDTSYVVAKAVLDHLIKGPKDEIGKYYPTLSPNLKVLSVTVKDNICYINFDQAFTVNALNVESYIPIYSIVNSLTELPGIQKVQILVNGVADTVFKDVIPLSNPLERNLDYVIE